MENILQERKLIHIDKPLNNLNTFWRPPDWDTNIEIDGYVVDIKDLFFKYKFVHIDLFKKDWFITYEIEEYVTLERIALEQYNDEKLFWVIPLINNRINPIFDFPLNIDEIEDLTKIMLTDKNNKGILKNKSYLYRKLARRIIDDLAEQYDEIVTPSDFFKDFEDYVDKYFDLFFGVLQQILIDNNKLKSYIYILRPNYIGELISGIKREIEQDFQIKNFYNYKKNE